MEYMKNMENECEGRSSVLADCPRCGAALFRYVGSEGDSWLVCLEPDCDYEVLAGMSLEEISEAYVIDIPCLRKALDWLGILRPEDEEDEIP